jgi:isoleucyl-tRNA synthetase
MAAVLGEIEFEDVCITSQIEVIAGEAPEGAFVLEDTTDVGVVFQKAQGNKCQRSWKILPDVGQYYPPDVCKRCSEALAELGYGQS